jgi:hypothetical protein
VPYTTNLRYSAKGLNPECCPQNREEEEAKFTTQVAKLEEELGSERRGRDGEKRAAAAAEVTIAKRDAALASLSGERDAACRERDAACRERDATLKQVGDAQIVVVARARGELDAARAQVARTPRHNSPFLKQHTLIHPVREGLFWPDDGDCRQVLRLEGELSGERGEGRRLAALADELRSKVMSFASERDGNPTPYTLHPTPYTLHPTPYTLHPTPCTLKHNSVHQCITLTYPPGATSEAHNLRSILEEARRGSQVAQRDLGIVRAELDEARRSREGLLRDVDALKDELASAKAERDKMRLFREEVLAERRRRVEEMERCTRQVAIEILYLKP